MSVCDVSLDFFSFFFIPRSPPAFIASRATVVCRTDLGDSFRLYIYVHSFAFSFDSSSPSHWMSNDTAARSEDVGSRFIRVQITCRKRRRLLIGREVCSRRKRRLEFFCSFFNLFLSLSFSCFAGVAKLCDLVFSFWYVGCGFVGRFECIGGSVYSQPVLGYVSFAAGRVYASMPKIEFYSTRNQQITVALNAGYGSSSGRMQCMRCCDVHVDKKKKMLALTETCHSPRGYMRKADHTTVVYFTP